MTTRRAVLFLLLAASAGCGRALGPERFATATARGTVRLRGEPVSGRWVEIVPIEGTLGRLRSARLAADGTFQVDRVPLGLVAIRLAGPRLPYTGEPRLDNFLFLCNRHHLIHKPHVAGVPIAIELRDEANALQRSLDARR